MCLYVGCMYAYNYACVFILMSAHTLVRIYGNENMGMPVSTSVYVYGCVIVCIYG